jgi:hypothetical protein
MSDVSDLYQLAIAQLEAVSADFKTSDEARDEANARIAELRAKAQDAALDDIAGRTDNLRQLAGSLSSVLEKSAGGASALQAVVDRVKAAIG